MWESKSSSEFVVINDWFSSFRARYKVVGAERVARCTTDEEHVFQADTAVGYQPRSYSMLQVVLFFYSFLCYIADN